jgi:hypothetical protein
MLSKNTVFHKYRPKASKILSTCVDGEVKCVKKEMEFSGPVKQKKNS